jgi:hypothetical protein
LWLGANYFNFIGIAVMGEVVIMDSRHKLVPGIAIALVLLGSASEALSQDLYVARQQPTIRVISESPYYAQPVYVEPTYGAYGQVHGRRWSAQVGYSSPVTTTVQQNIQVIAPPNSTVIVGEEHYPAYSYPVGSPYGYQRRVVEVVTDSPATPNRAKQWTDKSDMAR